MFLVFIEISEMTGYSSRILIPFLFQVFDLID